MRIVVLSNWFSENMGYAENFLPRALSKLGHEVHLITTNLQIYYNLPSYKRTYEPFLGPNIVECGIKQIDGFTLHRLPYFKNIRNPFNQFHVSRLGINGLQEYLNNLKPDIIQTFNILESATYEAAKYVTKNTSCKLFTESHIHASVFRKNNKAGIIERVFTILNNYNQALQFINKKTIKCYPIATDVAEIAISYLKVPEEKILIQSLGINTDLFNPISSDESVAKRKTIRQKLGYHDDDIVCIYTGRFSKGKNPQCLAQAIDVLNKKDYRFKALFVGNGTEEEISFIKSQQGCQVHSFVTVNELPQFYWAAEIGVWPREESTSQLDAAACGLPIILSNKISVMERVDGNGLLFEEGNFLDLADKIQSLKDSDLREKMGKKGIDNVFNNFSWDKIARDRIENYQNLNL